MKDQYGPEFWYVAIVGALFIGGFIWFLMPKDAKDTRETKKRFKRVVKEAVACIGGCESDEELKHYQETATNIFIEYFEILGQTRAIAGYDKMTQAIIKRTQQLQEYEKADK